MKSDVETAPTRNRASSATRWGVTFRGKSLGEVELSDAEGLSVGVGFQIEGPWYPNGSAEELELALDADSEAWITIEFLGRARITALPGKTLRAELAPACQTARRR